MKPTPAQGALLHAMLSAAVAVIMAFGVSIAQFYFAHGQDLLLTGSFAVGSFAATFAAIRTAVWHAAITSPVLPQAEKDTESQAMTLAQQALSNVESLAANVLPFVHNHPALAPQQPAAQGRVSNAVTSKPAPQPIVFPQPAPVQHISFGDTAGMPALQPPTPGA